MKILYLFIDGVGLREAAPDNPVNPEVCPALCRLIESHSKPIDACLGVEGLPQSATGQSTMFTGVNTPAYMKRHCEGFPGPNLRALIEKTNIFLSLKSMGRTVRFADAYLIDDADELIPRRFKSVTTVMALTAPEVVSTVNDLVNDEAVLQDLTRETIQDRWPDIPLVRPEDAAQHLFDISLQYDFTLFEYFQTDVAGHSLDYERACRVLREYDRFLSALVRFTAAAGITVVMTADHGNIEDMSSRTHTMKPVPFIVLGPHEEEMRERVGSLVDVTPMILESFNKNRNR